MKVVAEKTALINELRAQVAALELKLAEKDADHKSHFKAAIPHPPAAAHGAGPRHITDAKPYAWPYNGNIHSGNTAIIVIDMQNGKSHLRSRGPRLPIC